MKQKMLEDILNIVVKKRDGSKEPWNRTKIAEAIFKAARRVGGRNRELAEELARKVEERIRQRVYEEGKEIISVEEIDNEVLNVLKETGHETTYASYKSYNEKRKAVRNLLIKGNGLTDTTDYALLITSDNEELVPWNRNELEKKLIENEGLTPEFATTVTKEVENYLVAILENRPEGKSLILPEEIIESLMKTVLITYGLKPRETKQSIENDAIERLIFSKNQENSNIAVNNPEAVNLGIAETILKKYALNTVFSEEVAKAHLEAMIHVHDLGYPDRVYCSSHSLEYLKKYGLNKIVPNLQAKSAPPKSADVLTGQLQTMLASIQAYWAGALGIGYLNIFYSPLLEKPEKVVIGKLDGRDTMLRKKDLEALIENESLYMAENEEEAKKYEAEGKPVFIKKEEKVMLWKPTDKELYQEAQRLIFSGAQNAFSRGGQTLFLDFNIHASVPAYMRNVPAVGPGGKYMKLLPDGTIEFIDEDEIQRFYNEKNPDDPRNGDVVQPSDGSRILTYADFEETARRFAIALMQVWEDGDKHGRPFHFPKCDFHVDESVFNDEEARRVFEKACELASVNGSTYFIFDRGDSAILSQCCRLREKIEDKDMLKHPERIRFTGFQNVTINLAQAAYRAKRKAKSLEEKIEETLKNIDEAMEIAFKAHMEKKEYIQRLLETEGSPLYNLGQPSDDGTPYLDLEKATYIIGLIGLNEAVLVLTGKELHESKESYELGLKIISHMYGKIHEFKKRSGLKFALEETPAESATRRLAKIDLKNFPEAREVVKGTKDAPYYTNSIHFRADAPVSMLERVVGQSRFHSMIESGAIIHAYVGEKLPSAEAIMNFIEKIYRKTQAAQVTISPEFTECDDCGKHELGFKEKCSYCGSENVSHITRIVGYYSKVEDWNKSKQQERIDRSKATDYYANFSSEIDWIHEVPKPKDGKLEIMVFGKEGCGFCHNLYENIERHVKSLGIDNIELKFYDIENDKDARVIAAWHNIPLDIVPSLVIQDGNIYVKESTRVENGKYKLISPRVYTNILKEYRKKK